MDADQKQSISLLAVLAIALIIGIAVLVGVVPQAVVIINEHLAPGTGLKEAAVIAFIVTVILFVIFALAAGDGLLGEIQFMISGFAVFYLVCWLMIAWIF